VPWTSTSSPPDVSVHWFLNWPATDPGFRSFVGLPDSEAPDRVLPGSVPSSLPGCACQPSRRKAGLLVAGRSRLIRVDLRRPSVLGQMPIAEPPSAHSALRHRLLMAPLGGRVYGHGPPPRSSTDRAGRLGCPCARGVLFHDGTRFRCRMRWVFSLSAFLAIGKLSYLPRRSGFAFGARQAVP